MPSGVLPENSQFLCTQMSPNKPSVQSWSWSQVWRQLLDWVHRPGTFTQESQRRLQGMSQQTPSTQFPDEHTNRGLPFVHLSPLFFVQVAPPQKSPGSGHNDPFGPRQLTGQSAF